MTILLIIIHIMVCIALIMIVLLQTGKGADMGAAFGGGSSQTLFGSTGASTFLSKATTAAAIIFMVTSLGLAYLSSHRTGESVVTAPPAPVESQAAPATSPPPATGSSDTQPATGSGDTQPAKPAE
jgi:preprotein translocase subunit SecG